MPRQNRHKTNYPGVYYIEGTSVANGKDEKIYYIYYRKDGKQIEEKVGRQFQDDMTPPRASTIRAARINKEKPSNREQRDTEKAEKKELDSRRTLEQLWEKYKALKPINKGLITDNYSFNKHINPTLGKKELPEITKDDVSELKTNLLKSYKPQTVKHVLALLKRINNFGVNEIACKGIAFKIELPKVNNEKTEDLTPEQLTRLLKAIEEDKNFQAANMMKLALYSGMRRGEMFNLKWDDINWEREYILIREPKGGIDQKIPLNDAAKKLLKSHPKKDSPYVFPGRGGAKRKDIKNQVNRIRNQAGLPKGFRALHGLRHVYASILASSGKVDMYTLQKLLTHKSPQMTQRYAHLRDETLKKAANLAGELIEMALED